MPALSLPLSFRSFTTSLLPFPLFNWVFGHTAQRKEWKKHSIQKHREQEKRKVRSFSGMEIQLLASFSLFSVLFICTAIRTKWNENAPIAYRQIAFYNNSEEGKRIRQLRNSSLFLSFTTVNRDAERQHAGIHHILPLSFSTKKR